MNARLARSLLPLLLVAQLSAQETDAWKSWKDAFGPIAAQNGIARFDLGAGSERTLNWNESFADGRIALQWRGSVGTELWLYLRGSDEVAGTRIRLASPSPSAAILGPGGERSDADPKRWHEAEILARGASIEVRIDGGKSVSKALDPRQLDGSLSLRAQCADDRGTGRIELRAPTVESAGAHEWRTVLDGSEPIDDERWERVPGGTWTIEDGVVAGFCKKSEPRHGILLSKFEVDDFSARIVYRAVQGNSGFYFRCEKVKGAVGVHGFQAEIDATRDAGMLYETGGRARVQIPSKERVKKAFRPGEWNEMLVTAKGRRVEVYVNGYRMTQLVDDPGRLRGRLGLQLHGGQDMRVEVRSVELLEPMKTKR